MLDWKLIFSPRFWFALEWNPLQPKTGLFMAIFFGLFVLVGVVFWILPRHLSAVDKPLRRALAKGGNLFVVAGILGLFFTLTAYEQAGVFSGRFWFLFILVLFLVWGGWILWRSHIVVPAEREAAKLRDKFDQYLPKPKKR